MPFQIATTGVSGVATPQPNNVQHLDRPVIDITLAGAPRYQGFEAQVWTFNVLAQREMTNLFALYRADSPHVRITYHDPESGTWITRWAYMQRPKIGNRLTVIFLQVTVLFTHLSTSESA